VLLSQSVCEPCRGGSAPLTEAQITELIAQLDSWKLVVHEGIQQLVKVYVFADFMGALTLANKISLLAEEENHHPALLIEWGKLTVTWWTHQLSGLHKNDFIMASKTDAVTFVER
jgi:4a-hydroxytetrahydrobiopterin dehydratase